MEEIIIYKFQLEIIHEALRLTSRIHNSNNGETCFDRQIRQAQKYAENALSGKKDEKVQYMMKQNYKNPDIEEFTELELLKIINRNFNDEVFNVEDCIFEFMEKFQMTINFDNNKTKLNPDMLNEIKKRRGGTTFDFNLIKKLIENAG